MKKGDQIFYFTVIFFFIGLFIGVIFANLSCKNRAAEDYLLNRNLLMQIPFLEIRQKKLFGMIVQSRLKWFLLFALLTATPLMHRTAYLFGVWLGYGAGSLLTLAVIQYKAMGILVFLAAVMPQALFLIPGGYGMMHWILQIRRPSVALHKHGRLKKISSFAIFFIMVLLGIFMECYVNPFVLRMFVKIFL